MATLREQLDPADTLGVSAPRVDALLRHEALLVARFAAEVDAVDVGRDVHVRPTEVVAFFLACDSDWEGQHTSGRSRGRQQSATYRGKHSSLPRSRYRACPHPR